jgi:hypothetical protein
LPTETLASTRKRLRAWVWVARLLCQANRARAGGSDMRRVLTGSAPESAVWTARPFRHDAVAADASYRVPACGWFGEFGEALPLP